MKQKQTCIACFGFSTHTKRQQMGRTKNEIFGSVGVLSCLAVCSCVCFSLSLSLSLSCLCATYLSRLLLPRILLETDLYRRTRSNLNGATHRTKNRSPTFTFWEPLPILIEKERPLTFSRPCLSPFLYRVERRDFGLQRDAGILHNLFALGNASFLF